jgi:hypothetical protein
MRYSMSPSLQVYRPLSSSLAEALLRAWIIGDPKKVNLELLRSGFIEPEGMDEGEEAERIQLLKAIAHRMQTCPDLFAPRSKDPGLDLCVDLLAHLAGSQRAD